MTVVMSIGQANGGWKPYNSRLYLVNTETKKKTMIEAGSIFVRDDFSSDFFAPYRALCGHELEKPNQWSEWLCALEIYVAEYLRITKIFSLDRFSMLFHLALTQ